MSRLSLIAFLFLSLSHVHAQNVEKKRKLRVSPLPVIYYSPETRLGFGALLAINTNLGKDSLTTGSYMQSSFIYTLNKQYEWSNLGRLYFPDNKRIFQYRVYYAYFPEFFHGYQTQDPESFKESIEYNRLQLEFRHFWQVARRTYVGVYTRVNNIHNINAVDAGTFEQTQPPGYNGYTTAGIAPVFHIDSRDSQVYPRRGKYLEVLWSTFPSFMSDFKYSGFMTDFRYYLPGGLLNDDVFAFQILLNLNHGDVPFRDMADVGGTRMMRGYYTGYYRYKNLYAFQAEYRFMVHRYFGFAVWAGGCASSERWNQPFRYSMKPNAGIGFRVRINQKDKLNLRADYGVGRNQGGFYLDASEAF